MREQMYKLLTPGPLTTTLSVKEEMLVDRCTWDDDYKGMTQKIRKQLLEIGKVSEEQYTAILMQGSGSFSVESVLTTAVGKEDKCLIITNGAYGERIVTMAKYIGLAHEVYEVAYDAYPEREELERRLVADVAITHVIMVHCETTTGILNPLEEVAKVVKAHGRTLIIDAMSSFGGITIEVEKLGIDYLISSANKCIQGVPGFGFVLAKREHFLGCQGNARSLSLDLYAQWVEMNKDGKWRFTSPTHVVAAFAKALDELEKEGGVAVREKRYQANNALLRKRFKELGIMSYITEEKQSPIITTFLFPSEQFAFDTFYTYVKERGFVIYPGKLTQLDTFRIGNIGEIYEEDIEKLSDIVASYMKEVHHA